MNTPDQKPNTPKLDKWKMTQLAFDMGYIIALPVVKIMANKIPTRVNNGFVSISRSKYLPKKPFRPTVKQ